MRQPNTALDPAGRDVPGRVGWLDQAALAHEAELLRAQAEERTRPLRGSKLARLSSTRQSTRRGLRVPGLKAGRLPPFAIRGHRMASACSTLSLRPSGAPDPARAPRA